MYNVQISVSDLRDKIDSICDDTKKALYILNKIFVEYDEIDSTIKHYLLAMIENNLLEIKEDAGLLERVFSVEYP